MKNDNSTKQSNASKPMLYDGILQIMKENWSCNTGNFYAFWYGYDALKDCLNDIGIRDCSTNDLKKAMKETNSDKNYGLSYLKCQNLN